MYAVGNHELVRPLKKGDLVTCPKCSKRHQVKLATDTKTGKESDMIQSVKCGKKYYLVGVAGRKIPTEQTELPSRGRK